MSTKWPQVPLGEIAELRGRIGWRGLTAKEYTKSGPLFLSVHSLNHGDYVDFDEAFHISEERYVESPEIMLKENDVLICKDGAGIGKLGIVGPLPGPTTINSSLLLIRSSNKVLPKYLYRCLTSPYFQDIVQSRLNGATTPHLYQRDITEFPVVLPPLPEQERIVAILDEAFANIAIAKANTERVLKCSREVFSSQLDALLSKESSTWITDRLSNLTTKIGSGATPKGGAEAYKAEGISLIRSLNVHDLSFRYENLAFIDDAQARELNNVTIQSHDVLLNITGASVARCSVVPEDVLPARVNQHVSILRPKVDRLDSHFLHYLLISNTYKDRLLSTGEEGGSTRQALTKSELEAFEITFPESVVEQREVAQKIDDLLSRAEQLKHMQKEKLEALEELKKSLLHQAFAGQL